MVFAGHTSGKTRIYTLFLVIYLIIVSLLFEALILNHINHQHDNAGMGGSCAVCTQIRVAEEFIKGLGAGNKSIESVLVGLLQIVLIVRAVLRFITRSTPVSLKDRINN